MAPSVADARPAQAQFQKIHVQEHVSKVQQTETVSGPTLKREPMKTTGALDDFESFDMTPAIGREFPNANLAHWLQAPNADELLRDLAVTGMQRPKFLCFNSCPFLSI